MLNLGQNTLKQLTLTRLDLRCTCKEKNKLKINSISRTIFTKQSVKRRFLLKIPESEKYSTIMPRETINLNRNLLAPAVLEDAAAPKTRGGAAAVICSLLWIYGH